MTLPFFTKKEEIPNVGPEQIYQHGLAALHDILAPAALEINSNYFRIGKKFTRSFFYFQLSPFSKYQLVRSSD